MTLVQKMWLYLVSLEPGSERERGAAEALAILLHSPQYPSVEAVLAEAEDRRTVL